MTYWCQKAARHSTINGFNKLYNDTDTSHGEQQEHAHVEATVITSRWSTRRHVGLRVRTNQEQNKVVSSQLWSEPLPIHTL